MSEFDGTGNETPGGATPSAPPAAGAPAASASQTAPSSAPQEDRSNWIPPNAFRDRLRETRESAYRESQQTWAQREAEIRAEAETYKRQLHSIVGVTPPQNPEIDRVREQFASLYPTLAKLNDFDVEKLQELLERSGDLESQNEHYWKAYGRQTVNTLFTKASEQLGAPLSQEGKEYLHSSFVGWVQANPERANRYANDPSIVDEYLKGFGSSFIDPVRRTATAGIPGRANIPLPQDSPSGAPRVPGAPKLENLDERVAAGWAMLNANNNQHR